MKQKSNTAKAQIGIQGQAIVDRLEHARGRIEKRFLDGGTVLLSILDSIDKLVSTLDHVTGSLDEEAASRTKTALTGTMNELSRLPDLEKNRQEDLVAVSAIEKQLRLQVADMRETLRYLRTFAITAKISGAVIPDFAGFAAEIIERIQFGTTQAELFAEKLDGLAAKVSPATKRGRQILESYAVLIPGIVTDLAASADQLNGHHRELANTATTVRQLAGGVQMKLATVLSAMQVGDITRQRIEHCQLAFQVLGEYLDTPAGKKLKEAQRARLWLLIRQLVSRQLEQTHADFDRDTSKIVSTVSSFDAEIRHILHLGSKMKPDDDDASGSIIRQLECNIAKAKDIVHQVEAGAIEADALCQSTEAIVNELVQSIEVVKVVRTDIQYMALNTNLRCSKIGEEGRAINVITAELRNFAGLMDGTAENILVSLQSLQTTAARMRGTGPTDGTDERLETRLASASDSIHAAADQMDASLKNLDEQGRAAATLMKKAIPQLDFNAELGEILAECTALSAPEIDEVPALDDIASALEEIAPRIYKSYTMVAERDIHAEILGRPASAQPVVEQVFDNDDDLLETALF
ncbi:hypothetical protein [Rhizobium sp. RU36D]|uniref:hypothetical protein n=1 Tax=Rhizobium sp. RU36D TaxID=1907415 RepID=UPI0009D7C5B8|nr:hypothetical protein [Rhizobium sp. RU36D]SMC44619.1 hypothetical protein SAMN05880593_101407 [Rhizobium sp. RU36D]